MNERIKELALQATLEFSLAFESDKWQEKFAELIVQRCLEIIESEASMYNEPVWAISLFNEITEHFGVEE